MELRVSPRKHPGSQPNKAAPKPAPKQAVDKDLTFSEWFILNEDLGKPSQRTLEHQLRYLSIFEQHRDVLLSYLRNKDSAAKNSREVKEVWTTFQLQLVDGGVMKKGTPVPVIQQLAKNLRQKWNESKPAKTPSGSAALEGLKLALHNVSMAMA
jgi:hypothetical protein